MSLADYWPTEANIQQCVRPEAEADWNEVFLAVHQPMRLVRRAFANEASSKGLAVDEKFFLKEFLQENPSTGTLLMPILGSSGIGKSHLVRWLDIQLKQRSDSERRHVIRIPKSSSLKTVLHHVLEGLAGPRYEKIRKQLRSAREQLDVIGAEERIRSEILAEIRRRFDDARQRRAQAQKQGGKADQLDEEWSTHGDPERGLPALLSDPVTSRLFMAGTPQRPGVISQLARHLVSDSTNDQAPRRHFEESDFEADADLATSGASAPASRYLQTLHRQEGRERRTAVRLLNSVIDGALAPLASPTDTSLSEIFFEIRKQLLKDDRELVLLVEDFAVLSGIQGALLDAMIREGVRGDIEACVMRTALAVTAGYDFGRYDTVKTRAVHGWHVDESAEDADDEKLVDAIENYVGAYLNAARLGAERLKRLAADGDDHGPPDFGAENELAAVEQKWLNAFGRCGRGWHLFPFNRNAIRQLSELNLRDPDGQLRLNPRKIINHLLIDVLRVSRSAFIRGEFPSDPSLLQHARQVTANLLTDLRDAETDPGMRERYLTILRFWGDRPDRLADIDLPAGVYEGFGLKPLQKPVGTSATATTGSSSRGLRSADTAVVSRTGTDAVHPRPVVVEDEPCDGPTAFEHPPELRDWEKLLNEWSSTSLLQQKQANELRNLILGEVREGLDWDLLLLRRCDAKTWQGKIFLPHARGSADISVESAMCVVCSNEQFDSRDVHASIVLALLGLVRFDHYKTWDYPDGDLDYARWQNLADRLVADTARWVRHRKYNDVSGDPVPALVETLHGAMRLLNVEAAHKSDHASLLEALFESIVEPASGLDEDWGRLKWEAARHVKPLQRELLTRLAVRQGGAETVRGIDAVRLLDVVRQLKAGRQDVPSLPTAEPGTPLSESFQFARRFKTRLPSAVEKRKTELAGIGQRCLMELGLKFDKDELVTRLKELVTEAQKLGVLDKEQSANDLLKLCEEFRKAPVKEAIDQLGAIASGDFASQLSSLSRIDDTVILVLDRFVTIFSRCLKSLDSRLTSQLASEGEVLQGAKDRIETSLRAVDSQLHRWEGQPS